MCPLVLPPLVFPPLVLPPLVLPPLVLPTLVLPPLGEDGGGDGGGRIFTEHPSPILHAPRATYPVRTIPHSDKISFEINFRSFPVKVINYNRNVIIHSSPKA